VKIEISIDNSKTPAQAKLERGTLESWDDHASHCQISRGRGLPAPHMTLSPTLSQRTRQEPALSEAEGVGQPSN